WNLYLTNADEHDKVRMDSWKGDTSGILIFTGLFAATVAAFVIDSYKNLLPNTSNDTNALLSQLVYVNSQMAGIGINQAQPSSTDPTIPASFEPSQLDIAVNALWFLSLFIALACALSATLVQQWTR
ncbi:hypothetical protein K488DRAFT_27366, partial [Vararia minispora EC-137]